MADLQGVTVVFAARPGREICVVVRLSAGSTEADAIKASGLPLHHPDFDFNTAQTGIWGRPVARDRVISAHDRIEIYRQLTVDPKLARARRADKKRRSEVIKGRARTAG